MGIYHVKLNSQGEITQLPDSQKIFGALVHLMAEKSNDNATNFVKSVHSETEQIALSNMMPAGYLPTPKGYFESMHSSVSALKSEKDIHNEIKKRDFISEADLQDILLGDRLIEDTDYVTCVLQQQIRVNVAGDFRATGLPNNMFSVPKSICQAHCAHDDKPDRRIKEFQFFIEANEDSAIIQLLKDLEKGHLFILGKRSSQGFNLFSFQNIEESDDLRTNHADTSLFLNLGMLLPDKEAIDFTDIHSSLELFTSERRPFTMKTPWEKDRIKNNYISFIAPGSILRLKDTSEAVTAGRSVKSPFADDNAIIFGGSFLYPVEVAS